jgi:serine/threonine-protein kinase
VHRDIKPQNVLVGYEAEGIRARISDFGLAKAVNPLTLMASARGTRCFKSPEAFLDFDSDSCAGDVWAVGVTMYLLLTDRFPVNVPENDVAIDPKVFDAAVMPPSRLNIHVNPGLDRILDTALAKNPKSRYRTALELLRDLEHWDSTPHDMTSAGDRSSSQTSKIALGPPSTPDQQQARRSVSEAFETARGTGRLQDAADMLEEAMNKFPERRCEFESQIKLWRRGILM